MWDLVERSVCYGAVVRCVSSGSPLTYSASGISGVNWWNSAYLLAEGDETRLKFHVKCFIELCTYFEILRWQRSVHLGASCSRPGAYAALPSSRLNIARLDLQTVLLTVVSVSDTESNHSTILLTLSRSFTLLSPSSNYHQMDLPEP